MSDYIPEKNIQAIIYPCLNLTWIISEIGLSASLAENLIMLIFKTKQFIYLEQTKNLSASNSRLKCTGSN